MSQRYIKQMKYGISTASFYPMQTEEGLLLIAKRNVPYIEVFLDTFSEVKKEFVTELRKTADFYGSSITSVHPFTSGFEPFMLFTEYQRRFDDALEFHRHYFEAMNILGAKIFVLHGDRANGSIYNEGYFERFAKLRDIGKEFGVIVAQENVERCKSKSIDFLVDMIKYLDNDVAIVFDNKQAARSGVTWKEFADKLYDSIVHIHLSDSCDECDCVAIGNGTLNLDEFISYFAAKAYNGCMVVELYRQLLLSDEEIFNSYNKLKTYND